MNDQERLEKRVVEGAAKYLQMWGMTILDQSYQCPFGWADIVARDDEGTIRFVLCRASRWALPKAFEVTPEVRERYERIAIAWLDDHPDMADSMLTFDNMDVGVFGENYNRAIIRHYRNVLELPDAAFQPEK